MKNGLRALVAAAALAVGGAVAHADSFSYDAPLVAPGFFAGSGNPNGGFTIDNGTDKIEVGLRAKYRQSGNVINTPNNVYWVSPGPETTTTTGNSLSNKNDAAWNFEFSINTAPAGLTLADITSAVLTMTNVTTGVFTTVDALNPALQDNLYLNSSNQAVEAQNSENPVFTSLFPQPYDMNAIDQYEITLEVKANDGADITDTIFVNVAPLPASAWTGLAILGTLAGFAGIKRFGAQLA